MKQRNYTNKQLIFFVDHYIKKHSLIKSRKDIAEFTNKEFDSLPVSVKAYDFNNSKEVNEYINEKKRELEKRHYAPSVYDDKNVCSIAIDANELLNSCHNREELLEKFHFVIEELEKAQDDCRKLLQVIKDDEKKINEKDKEIVELKSKLNICFDELSEVKAMNNKQKDNLSAERLINKRYKEFIDYYITDPVIFNHLIEIGIIDSNSKYECLGEHQKELSNDDNDLVYERIESYIANDKKKKMREYKKEPKNWISDLAKEGNDSIKPGENNNVFEFSENYSKLWARLDDED